MVGQDMSWLVNIQGRSSRVLAEVELQQAEEEDQPGKMDDEDMSWLANVQARSSQVLAELDNQKRAPMACEWSLNELDAIFGLDPRDDIRAQPSESGSSDFDFMAAEEPMSTRNLGNKRQNEQAVRNSGQSPKQQRQTRTATSNESSTENQQPQQDRQHRQKLLKRKRDMGTFVVFKKKEIRGRCYECL